MARSGLFGASGALSRLRGIEMRAVRPVFVSMLARIIESVRMPMRSAPASEPSSRMLTRAWLGPGVLALGDLGSGSGCRGGLAEDLRHGALRDRGVLGELERRAGDDEDHQGGERRRAARVRARSSLVGRDCTAVRMIEPHQRMPPTTKATASVCSTVGRATIDSAAFVTPVRIT